MRRELPELELGNQVCFALYRASRAMIRSYTPALGALDLTYPQYLVLLVLWEADEPLAVRDIGDQLGLDSGTLTPLLKRLETRAIIRRARDQADERRTLITLTEAGLDLRDTAAGVPESIAGRFPLEAAHGRALREDLIRIAEAFEAAEPRSTRSAEG